MAATGTPTPNLGLRIPVGTDPASVDDINYNSNLLDTVLGAVGNTSVKDQLDGLSDQIATLVKKTRTVTTTDSDGDAQALSDITGKVILSVIPIRNAGDGTYSSWFGIIIGGSSSGIVLSVKCVNDNNVKLASTKVAMDVYYIEQTFS